MTLGTALWRIFKWYIGIQLAAIAVGCILAVVYK
jgi:hypothetical protein